MRRACRQARTAWWHTLYAVAVAVLLAVPAHAGGPDPDQGPPGEREVTVFNHGSRPINEIYVSPQTADQWGEDRLGERTLEPGAFLRLHLGRTRACAFDVKIIYDDAGREEQRDVNLCRTLQVAFNGSTATAAPGIGVAHSVTLVNQSARPIQQVFISPAEANQWGDDHLEHGGISVAGRRGVTWRGDCNVDLRVVFENRAAEERRGIDLCAVAQLSIEPGWTTADALPEPRTEAPAEAAAANRSDQIAILPP
jgi:hypothetical protein